MIFYLKDIIWIYVHIREQLLAEIKHLFIVFYAL